MAEIGRDYLWSLLQMASRMAEYLEGLTPDQRSALEILAQAPGQVDDGWMLAKTVRDTLDRQGFATLGGPGLAERGLIEIKVRFGGRSCYRITDEGIALLARIEEREECDEILGRIRAEWQRTVQPRKKGPPAVAPVKSGRRQTPKGEVRRVVVEALSKGPATFTELRKATDLEARQLENQLRRLRGLGRVHRLRGVYSLINHPSQSKGGAA